MISDFETVAPQNEQLVSDAHILVFSFKHYHLVIGSKTFFLIFTKYK